MKALLIDDEKNLLERIKSLLEKSGYDTITYSLFIKALDNLEEIAPHLIVVNACEFPRQWKMLCQYLKSFNLPDTEIMLLTDNNFSEEDKNKARYLGINKFFNCTLKDTDFINLFNKEKNIIQVQTVFTNPHNQSLMTGKSFIKNDELFFDADNDLSLSSFCMNEKIVLYLNTNNQFRIQNAFVKNINTSQIAFTLEEAL